MATEIVMPKVGNTVESVIIIKWLKNIGDDVAVGEAICEVETDKATVEVESETAGTLLVKLYQDGEEAPVQMPFAVLGEADEVIPSPAHAESSTTSETGDNSAKNPSPTHPPISPRARRRAEAEGLHTLPEQGRGPGGRIIEADVQKHLAEQPVAEAEEESTPMEASPSAPGDFPGPVEHELIKGVRKHIAQRMRTSLRESAQLTLNTSVTADGLLQCRKSYKESPEELKLSRITINDVLMFTVSRVLMRHPNLNATYSEGRISRFRHVHMGFAVDAPRGLMVPVIRYADTMPLAALSAEAHRLATACREGSITADELNGGTFTISNLGALGVTSFTPVINIPEVAILGVGAITNVPGMKNDEVVLEKHLTLSLTIDHQVVDGVPGALFLKDLGNMIARPEWAMAI